MVLKLTDIAPADSQAEDSLTLPFDIRQKSRFSAITDNGQEVGVFLTRGQILRSGMVLSNADGVTVMIKAADEAVSVMRSAESLPFARACYHLGNRHVPLHIQDGEVRYLSDHVLDHMLEGLGLKVTQAMLPFEPEAGAYHNHHDH